MCSVHWMRLSSVFIGISALWLMSGSLVIGVTGDVSWFLHMSDLHVSGHYPKRESELHPLLRNVLSDFQFSSVLFTGDLVEGKKNRWRSGQSQMEWEGYQRIISTVHSAFGISNDTFIDIRGNHDMFDVPIRNSDHDFYRRFGEQGQNWEGKNVLDHPIFGIGLCPIYVFVGVDLSPDVGLRSPINFLGRMTDDIVKEFESVVTESMRNWYNKDCDPIYLAYAHYPLSMIAKESYFIAKDDNELEHVAFKYGIDAWLCGHLHSQFGEHLFRIHNGHASTLLELETMDWKDNRRFRIVAVDDKHLSFVNLQLKDRSLKVPSIEGLDSETVIDGAVILMTSPPSPYFSPLGNSRIINSTVKEIHALVWPIQTKKEDLLVFAEFYCDLEMKQTFRLKSVDKGPLYKTVDNHIVDDTLCPGAELTVRVKVEIQGTDRVSTSENRRIRSRTAPVEYSHSWKEKLVLRYRWYNVFQNFSVSFFLIHIVFLLFVPKALWVFKRFRSKGPSLDEDSNGKQDYRYRFLSILMAPVYGIGLATEYPFFWWGQLCFILLMMFGPWYFARTLSNAPLSIVFLSTVYAHPDGKLRSVFGPEMTLRACFYYIVVIVPTTLWIMWTLNRFTGKRNGTCKRHKFVFLFYILMGIICFASFVQSACETWFYYGPLAFLLSPSLLGWLLLNILTVITATRFSVPKCRQE